MPEDISSLRNDYIKQKLNKSDLFADPILQFKNWLLQAIDSKVYEPTAMTLATSNLENKPSARIVLLKFVNEDGFAFFTNYNSRKGIELTQNPNAALVFYWPELERQVRVEGSVSKLGNQISDEYFNSRPEQSRISAIVSPQSQPIPDREFLEKKVNEFIASKNEIIRPDNWGGFILNPERIEFWQGRESRLHDRFLYEKSNKMWQIIRLAP
ncbi:MAG: pyridoxamine 5'-phosphate oxidase [Melioribacteraceae bacterium]|jgi:pyridoxamine 5'-phosphate oxidase|nr:MAG: pyridoxamine 5'-phosphate oxidase [Ignavibacteriales bacterium]WKZ68266.1 MAG: pyridoxamine 5'-phosphate oxidase [Melioribacteraceae bacterium]